MRSVPWSRSTSDHLSPKCFALAKPESQRDYPAGTIPALADNLQQALDFIDPVWVDLFLAQLRRLCLQHRVTSEMVAPHGLVERVRSVR